MYLRNQNHYMLDVTQYREQIIAEKNNIIVPDSITNQELINSYINAKAIENILLPLFNKQSPQDLIVSPQNINTGTNAILQIFRDRVLEILEHEERDFHQRHQTGRLRNQNLFEVANTVNLFLSNKYTRVISENLGHKLEDIATLSPKIINPETHFNFKIKGVDVIIYENFRFYFTQLKTKKDTLTGSQKPRSEMELGIHTNSRFVACLSLGSWTFNTDIPNIERLEGSQFWDKINIDYNSLIDNLSDSLQKIEAELFNDE